MDLMAVIMNKTLLLKRQLINYVLDKEYNDVLFEGKVGLSLLSLRVGGSRKRGWK
jgi:hypothetical protein